MILLLDTSTAECRLWLVGDDDEKTTQVWQADREMARFLIRYLWETLGAQELTWDDITGIGVFRGPGSFTGLRIGMTVLNTIASSEHIPIVGAEGENWQDEVLAKLRNGQDDKIVLPHYGRDARITKPRK